MMNRSRSGISPVVATVILVAIAIVIAIAVAFWATGLVGIFTRYERLEITSVYAIPAAGGTYTVTITAKNTGSNPATIDQVLLNGVPVIEIGKDRQITFISTPQSFPFKINDAEIDRDPTLNPGDTARITLNVEAPAAGITVEVALHTASGKLYPYSVLLP